MEYDIKKVTSEQMANALDASGIPTEDIIPTMADFLSDGYWNDPKCISRRINLSGGDPGAFYAKMHEYGFTFDSWQMSLECDSVKPNDRYNHKCNLENGHDGAHRYVSPTGRPDIVWSN